MQGTLRLHSAGAVSGRTAAAAGRRSIYFSWPQTLSILLLMLLRALLVLSTAFVPGRTRR